MSGNKGPNHVADLELARQGIERAYANRDQLIGKAWEAGLTAAEIEDACRVDGPRTVNKVISEHRKTMEARAFEATADLWLRGQVVEDRWGLRWRADTHLRWGRGWFCRSVGLRIFRTGEQMAERGPLRRIRVDQVFAGPEAAAAREAGEVEDRAVTVEPHEDPE